MLVYLVIDQENVGSSPGTIHFKRCYLLSYYNGGKKMLEKLIKYCLFSPQTIVNNVRGKLILEVNERNRRYWTRSPLNVATHKMRTDLVR
jgi:hypothetical protein